MKKICSFLASAGLLLTLTGGGLAEAQTNETGVLRAGSVPAIGSFLQRGEQVEVTEKADETHVYVQTEQGTAMVDVRLLRFADEPFAPWQGTLRAGSRVYAHFSMLEEPETLRAAASVSVVEELDGCYCVSFGDTTGYVPKDAVTRTYTGSPQPGAGEGTWDDTPAAPTEAPPAPTSPPPISRGDGEDMVLISAFTPLSRADKTGLAAARADDVPLVLFSFQLGQEVTLLTAPEAEKEGYLLISLPDDGFAYVPAQWVRTPGQAENAAQVYYAGANCRLYDSYLLLGEAEKTLPFGSEVTVYSQAQGVSYVLWGEIWGFVPSDCLNRFPVIYTPAEPAAPDVPDTPDVPDVPDTPAAPSAPASEWSPPVL